MKSGYKDSGGSAKSKNNKYMPSGMNLIDGAQASAPRKCDIPMGQGFSEVTPFKSGNLGYPKQAFNYKY